MKLSMAIGIYIFIWWTLLFAVLPWGVRTQGEDGKVVPGTPASAPVQPRILRVVIINTVVSTVVFAIVYAAITRGWVPILEGVSPPPAR